MKATLLIILFGLYCLAQAQNPKKTDLKGDYLGQTPPGEAPMVFAPSWTDPVRLGEPINSNQMERFPAVSPEGKYLFFTRDTMPGYNEDVYWVSAGIIGKLKAKAIQEQRLKQ